VISLTFIPLAAARFVPRRELAPGSETGGGQGDERQRDHERAADREADHERDLADVDLHLIGFHHEQPGPDDDRRRGRGQHGHHDLPRAEAGRIGRRHAGSLQAVDVLDHDDGVVDEHPDAHHQPEHRQHVELQPEREHPAAGHEQRERDRDRDDQGGRQAAQEEEQHADRQEATEDPRVAQPADRLQDLLGLVLPDQQVDPLQLGIFADQIDPGQQSFDRLDGVRRGLLVHVETDGEVAVEVAPTCELRLAKIYGCDVA